RRFSGICTETKIPERAGRCLGGEGEHFLPEPLHRDLAVLRLDLDADGAAPQEFGGLETRSGAHIGVYDQCRRRDQLIENPLVELDGLLGRMHSAVALTLTHQTIPLMPEHPSWSGEVRPLQFAVGEVVAVVPRSFILDKPRWRGREPISVVVGPLQDRSRGGSWDRLATNFIGARIVPDDDEQRGGLKHQTSSARLAHMEPDVHRAAVGRDRATLFVVARSWEPLTRHRRSSAHSLTALRYRRSTFDPSFIAGGCLTGRTSV